MPQRIKGAIFDLDGTLIDSLPLWESLGSDYLTDLGIEHKSDLNESLKTMSLYRACKYLHEYYVPQKSTEQILDDISEKIKYFYSHKAKAKNGAVSFVERLAENGVKMCIATASEKELAKSVLKLNGMESFFSNLITCSQFNTDKNSGLIYNKALNILSTPKEETFIFEDASYAAETAKKNGFGVIGVYDKSENENTMKRFADKFIYSFDELNNYFEF